MTATWILHADADAFFASVEQRDDPRLRGRPVLVGSWVVMAASYEARACGVRSGMPGSRARRLCPAAVVVQPRRRAYVEAGRALFEVFERFAPRVEGASMEEAFLEVRTDDPADLAATLRATVRDEVGLPVTVGAARTKVLAKLASRAAKPDGLLVVPPERELAFLHPLPVDRLWGVGPATAAKLQAHGVQTVGQAARLDEADLMAMVGKAAGRYVHAVAQNREFRRVRTRRGRRSFGAQKALGRPRRADDPTVDAALATVAERIARRMARAGRTGRTITVRVRFGDRSRAARSRTLTHATAAEETLLALARELLPATAPAGDPRGVNLVGLTVSGLDAAGGAEQLALPIETDVANGGAPRR